MDTVFGAVLPSRPDLSLMSLEEGLLQNKGAHRSYFPRRNRKRLLEQSVRSSQEVKQIGYVRWISFQQANTKTPSPMLIVAFETSATQSDSLEDPSIQDDGVWIPIDFLMVVGSRLQAISCISTSHKDPADQQQDPSAIDASPSSTNLYTSCT